MRNFIFRLFTGLLCLQGYHLSASVDNVPVETRPLTHAERVAIMELRATEPVPSQEFKPNASIGNFDAGVTYVSVHPGAYHQLASTTPGNEKIELTDGSVWTTFPGDRAKMAGWEKTHDLVFVQNKDEFASYRFKIIDTKLSNSTVQVNLTLGPKYSGDFTYWVIAINPDDRKIVLCDNSQWDMSRFDANVYKKWKVNDTIIIGVNDGSLSSFNPNILINVETLSYVRASLDH